MKNGLKVGLFGLVPPELAMVTSGSGAFNLETAINDLWVALDCVKRGQQTTSLKAQSQNAAMGDTVQMMSSIMKQMHDSTASVINNMR